ncbi:MAG TPA: DUF6458 family protein [Solirubrobacteraceae bacterium]|nr:DUF6458 family protein [Solirubrobacteraceae bacterium]
MGIGTSIFLIAVGAILRWGVADAIEGVNLAVIGLILMIAGVVGLAVSLIWANAASRRAEPVAPAERPVVRERDVY